MKIYKPFSEIKNPKSFAAIFLKTYSFYYNKMDSLDTIANGPVEAQIFDVYYLVRMLQVLHNVAEFVSNRAPEIISYSTFIILGWYAGGRELIQNAIGNRRQRELLLDQYTILYAKNQLEEMPTPENVFRLRYKMENRPKSQENQKPQLPLIQHLH